MVLNHLLHCDIGREKGEGDLELKVVYKAPCMLLLASIIKQKDGCSPHCCCPPPRSILNELQPNGISHHIIGIKNLPCLLLQLLFTLMRVYNPKLKRFICALGNELSKPFVFGLCSIRSSENNNLVLKLLQNRCMTNMAVCAVGRPDCGVISYRLGGYIAKWG